MNYSANFEEYEDPTESTNVIYLNRKARDGNALHESFIIVKGVSAKDVTDSIGVRVAFYPPFASITHPTVTIGNAQSGFALSHAVFRRKKHV